MNEEPKIFRKSITVEPEHLDDLNHVNNAVYVQWIQEIAREHWLSLETKAHGEDAYWVVLEHHIQYYRQAFLNDRLELETYVESPKGVRFPRWVKFYRDNDLIVQANTVWCWVDTVTNRPKRIPGEVLQGFL